MFQDHVLKIWKVIFSGNEAFSICLGNICKPKTIHFNLKSRRENSEDEKKKTNKDRFYGTMFYLLLQICEVFPLFDNLIIFFFVLLSNQASYASISLKSPVEKLFVSPTRNCHLDDVIFEIKIKIFPLIIKYIYWFPIYLQKSLRYKSWMIERYFSSSS